MCIRDRYISHTPYLYSTYEHENESISSNNKKIIVLGSGPIRIGQGVEFDYATVHLSLIHIYRLLTRDVELTSRFYEFFRYSEQFIANQEKKYKILANDETEMLYNKR